MQSILNKEDKFIYLLYVILLTALYFYFPFSAEDSYIVARYAYNFGTYGELAYNIEEPISALTSPFHAILEGLLYSLIKYDPVVIWKFFSVILLFLTIGILQSLLISKSQKTFFFISVALSSSILLWTVGGLETPLLMFLVSLFTLIFLKKNTDNINALILLGILSGVIFLTRFDSAIFLLPISLYILWFNKDRLSNISAFLIPAICIVLLWFVFSKLYYGHFMPTSFFAKKPGLSIQDIIATLSGLLWTGALPIAGYVLYQKNEFLSSSKNKIILIGLFFVILYMFTMANKHMMFSFRAFVPYLPIVFFILILLKKKISKIAIALLLIFQLGSLYTTYNFGINYPVAELIEREIVPIKYKKYFHNQYALLTIPSYIEFMNSLHQQGVLINRDWKSRKILRKAIVLTYAEGVASYSGINNYYTGSLVTKGACRKPDYIMGLHFLDAKKSLHGINSNNKFLSNELNFYVLNNRENAILSVSRYDDLNEINKKALWRWINSCNSADIW